MKKALLLWAFFTCSYLILVAQQYNVPYYSSFDAPTDTIGWSHEAISGVDDWELGFPQKFHFNFVMSAPNAWVTNLVGNCNQNSDRVLTTPYFDLSNTFVVYTLSFYHERQTNNSNNTDYFVEYSQGSSNVWTVLNDASATKVNWQTTSSGFIFLSGDYMSYSSTTLYSIQGQDSIRFRFRFISETVNAEGWIIDNFRISSNYVNITATPGAPITISKLCPSITVSSVIGYSNDINLSYTNTTQYYLSNDSLLDAQDQLLGTKTGGLSLSTGQYSHNLTLPANMATGKYYIVYKHDANNTLPEDDEMDNVSFAPLYIDSIYSLPIVDDFEAVPSLWKASTRESETLVWHHGQGTNHATSGTHSGNLSWHTSSSKDLDNRYCDNGNNCFEQYLYSPYIDFTSDTAPFVISFWKRTKGPNGLISVQYKATCGIVWSTLGSLSSPTINDWEFVNMRIPSNLATSNNIRFRIKYLTGWGNGGTPDVNIDDIYIGPIRPDISIEKDKFNRSLIASNVTDTIWYYLSNAGLAPMPASTTEFYWSTDSILDANDLLLGSKQEPALGDTTISFTNFVFTKPTIAPGTYYLLYKTDAANSVAEMREYNNTGYFKVYQYEALTLPYYNDFANNISGWRTNATLKNEVWQWGVPMGGTLPAEYAITKAWVVNNNNVPPDMARMHLYTPVFDLSGTVRPVIEFDLAIRNVFGNSYNGVPYLKMSYSIDGGANWTVLDTTNRSFSKWYYQYVYSNSLGVDNLSPTQGTTLLFDFGEKSFVGYDAYYGRNEDDAIHHVLDLSFLNGNPSVQFRFNMATDDRIQSHGPVIDNFSVTEGEIDLTVLFQKELMVSKTTDSLKLEFYIKNLGNYISDSTNIVYYLSKDTILDGSDYFLATENILPVQPGMRYYLNTRVDAPLTLSAYQYLFYKLDDANTNIESNEVNNSGYYPLKFEGVFQYPYLEDFDSIVVNGWKPYVLSGAGGFLKNGFRFRNEVAINESFYSNSRKTGEMFTDLINNVLPNSAVPYWYLESPSFNFAYVDSISITFDLMCTGQLATHNEEGGNLQFSVNGGNSWAVLSEAYGDATGWYEDNDMIDLFGQPGWTGTNSINYFNTDLEPRAFDASFLTGKTNVVFRFQYHSNHLWFSPGPQGMRVDNFRIEGFSTKSDYEALDQQKSISANYVQPIPLKYSVKNNGNGNGAFTTTAFYWSADGVLDSTDQLLFTQTQPPIASGTTVVDTAYIALPPQLIRPTYYLFYVTDESGSLIEANENDNIGSFVVSMDSTNSIDETILAGLEFYVSDGKLYITMPSTPNTNDQFGLKIYTVYGQLVYQHPSVLAEGKQVVSLPSGFAAGVYLVSISNSKESRTLRTVLYR